MNIGIIGLGLIGGSLAKAIRSNTDHTVLGYDHNETVLRKALMIEAIDQELPLDHIHQCDLTIVALYPQDTVDFVLSHKTVFKPGSVVLDCCGIKRPVCAPLYEAGRENGFSFIGGHPMAGMEFSGFDYSKTSLFENASMILVPSGDTDIGQMHSIKALFLSIGFSRIQLSTPQEHDQIIACTSQLAHIVSSAYVKSPVAAKYKGYTAGSFADMTRVAKLNERMWTELLLDNRDNLIREIDGLIVRLAQYKDCLQSNDAGTMRMLLAEGRAVKESLEN